MKPLSFLAVLSLLCLAGCQGQELSRPKEVVVYASVDQIYSAPILKDFERKTGIKVKAVYDVEASKAVGLANRVIAEKRRPRADVFWNGEFTQTIRLKKEGLLVRYQSPSAKGFPASLKDPDGFWTGVAPRYRVWISSRSFPPRPISFEGLPQVDRPGSSIAISLPLFGTGAFQAAALAALLGDDESAALYESYLKKGVKVAPGNAAVRDWVVAGQAELGLTDSDDACGAMRRGARVNVFLPTETLIIPGTVGMIKGGPNPSEAQALIDWLLGPETEAALIESGFSEVALHPESPQPCLGLPNPKPLKVGLEEIAAKAEASAERMKVIFAQ